MPNNYLLTKDGKLYQIPNDSLYHADHKYVKREKVKGKWRYWYKDDLKDENSSKTETANKSSSTSDLKKWLNNAKNKVEKASTNVTTNIKKSIDKAEKIVDDMMVSTKKTVETKISNNKKKAEATKQNIKIAVAKTKTGVANKIADTKDKIEDKVDDTKDKIESWKQDVKETRKENKEAAVEFVKSVPDRTLGAVNKSIDKIEPAANKLIDDLDEKVTDYFDKNKYYTNSKSIKEKREQVMKTKEWQDIVARNDPEYVKIQPDGSKKYLVDDYIVKKKHPLLDAVDDIASGRDISVNEIEKDAVLASAKEYVDTAQQVLGIVAEGLLLKFKVKQGSYAAVEDAVDNGKEYVDNAGDLVGIAYTALSNIASNGSKIDIDADALSEIGMSTLNYIANGLDEDTTKKIVSSATKAAVSSLAKDATNGAPDTIILNATRAAVTSALGNVPDELVDGVVDNLIDDIVTEVNRSRVKEGE